MNDQAADYLAEQRIQLCRRWPYCATPVLSLIPHQSKACPTAGVSEKWVLVYSPEFVLGLTPDELQGLLAHEVCHLLQKHHKRAKKYCRTERDYQLWNLAADMAINPDLLKSGLALPSGGMFPTDEGFSEGLTTEEYYQLLQDKYPPDPQDGGKQPEPSQTGGSCSDGQNRAWEESQSSDAQGDQDEAQDAGDAKSEPLPEGLDEADTEAIISKVVESASKGVGKLPNSLRRVVDEYSKPKISPERLLALAIQSRLAVFKQGPGRSSYRRPSRRPSIGGTCRPVTVRPCPMVKILIDSSGSMGKRDLGLALGLVANVLGSLRDMGGVEVVTGDTQLSSAQKVFHPSQIEITGGGGTDVGAMLVECCEKSKPDLIIAITDGETPWPEEKLRTPVVACLTRKPSEYFVVPEWIKSVILN